MRRLLFAFTAAIVLAIGLAQPAAATDQVVTQGTAPTAVL
jgi:hypothetical protein